MAYAIMRAKKLSSMGNVASSLQHCFRERETHNADASRTPDNEHREASSTSEAMGRLREMLPEKRRKDAVLAVEYVMTASPGWWETASPSQQTEFFDRSMSWLAEKYGADRIVTASIHRDETSPHLSAFVVPLTADGRLSAKEFIGSKVKMSADQTSYAAKVRDLGLERGIEGSRANHERVASFYGAIAKPVPAIEITPETVAPRVLSKKWHSTTLESPEMVANRVTKAVSEAYAPVIERARKADLEARRATESRQALQSLQKRAEPFLRALEPLKEAGRGLFGRLMSELGAKLHTEQQRDDQQRVQEARAKIERQREGERDANGKDRGGRGR
ncbi:Plasmid recombination enzyme [subsurface metagenome]